MDIHMQQDLAGQRVTAPIRSGALLLSWHKTRQGKQFPLCRIVQSTAHMGMRHARVKY